MCTAINTFKAARMVLNAGKECVQEIKADGNAAFKKGDIAAAVDFYSQAIDMDRQCGDDDEKTAVLYTNRAAAYLRQAEVGFDDAWEKVERDCRRAIERHPTAKAYMRCARALTEGLDRHGDALCCLAEALVLEPRSTAVQEAVGNLRVEHTEMSDHPPVLQSVEKLRKRQQMRERMDEEPRLAAQFDLIFLLWPQAPIEQPKKSKSDQRNHRGWFSVMSENHRDMNEVVDLDVDWYAGR